MSTYKLIIEGEKFPEDLVFALKILSLTSAQKDLSDTALVIPASLTQIKSLLESLLEKEKLLPLITQEFPKIRQIKYIFILADNKNRIKKLSANPIYPGVTLIYTARFPCPQNIKTLPYFNAASSKNQNYSLT